jgi:hypothetical protein
VKIAGSDMDVGVGVARCHLRHCCILRH